MANRSEEQKGHNEWQCIDCGNGSTKCVCVHKEHCVEKREFQCKLSSDKKTALKQLEARRKYRCCENPMEMGCRTFDPFKISNKCWFTPRFVQEGECHEDCKHDKPSETSHASSSTEEESEETPIEPTCCHRKEKKCRKHHHIEKCCCNYRPRRIIQPNVA